MKKLKAFSLTFPKCKSGFTLIEMLIFLFIFSLITVTFYYVWSLGTNQIIFVKNKLTAIALANEKMEIVKNLAFDDIAHTTGSPQGNLHQDEDVVRNGKTFHVLTQIRNIDDPFDGTLEDGTDSAFIDYKIVRITVSWDQQNNITLSSRFVPAGIEQPTAGLGVLVVNVSSDKKDGELISGSSVRIQNSEVGFDETHTTDNLGRLLLVGIPESIKKYQITVSKSGYENVSTMPPYPDTTYDPTHEHASVVAGAVNTIDIYQNEFNHFALKSADYLGNAVSNISFHLKGGKKIGTDHTDSSIIIYNKDEDGKTGSDGSKNYGETSPGQYEFTLSETGYSIIGTNMIDSFSATDENKLFFTIDPGATSEFKVKLSPANVTALLLKVRDAGNNPVQGATVHLTNSSGYDQTITTEADGMAFFPNQENQSFVPGTYDLSVTAVGFVDYSSQITVNGSQLKSELVSLAIE